MEEVIIDLRVQSEERKKESIRSTQICFQINHTMPMTEEYHALINELFNHTLDAGTIINPPIFINLAENVKIGRNVVIMNGFQCMSAGGLVIENDVRISLNCTIATNNHDFYDRDVLTCKPVLIKKNAWIGENAIIGAGAVVTKDIPDNAVAVGNPAKVVKYLNAEKFDNR